MAALIRMAGMIIGGRMVILIGVMTLATATPLRTVRQSSIG